MDLLAEGRGTLLGASFVLLLTEGSGAPVSAVLPTSLVPLLADGKGADEMPCPDRRTAATVALLLDSADALLADGKGAIPSLALPSAPAAAFALAFLPKLDPLFLLSGRCLAAAMGAAALLSDSPS